MQCGVEKRMIKRQEMIVVKCFKCGEREYKCRECLLWKKRKRGVEEEKAALMGITRN